jgi:catalase
VKVDKTFATTASVLFDAVLVPGGAGSVATLRKTGDALHFIQEAFKHGKAVGGLGEGVDLVEWAQLPGVELSTRDVVSSYGVVTSRRDVDPLLRRFVQAVAQHRHFDRPMKELVAA